MNIKNLSALAGLLIAHTALQGMGATGAQLNLLRTQLLALSSPKKAAFDEEKKRAGAGAPQEETKGAAEAEMKAGEPHLIDFEHPALKKLLLTAAYNYNIPDQVPLKIGNVTVVQLLVAWQDLQAVVFLQQPPIKRVGLLHENHYTEAGTQYLIQLLQDANKPLREKLKNKTIQADAYLGGGTVSCGYHTIKNLLLTLNLIYGQKQETDVAAHGLVDLDLTNSLFGTSIQNTRINENNHPGIWRSYLISKKQKTIMPGTGIEVELYPEKDAATADWLEWNGLYYLWTYYPATTKNIAAGLNNMGAPYALPAIEVLYKNKKEDIELLLATKGALNDQFKKSATAQRLFVVHVDNNHWIALVLNKVAGEIQCIILDSKNWPRYHHPTVKNFIKIFTDATIPPMAQRKKTDAEVKAEEKEAKDQQKQECRARLQDHYNFEIKDNLKKKLEKEETSQEALAALVANAFGAGRPVYIKEACDIAPEDLAPLQQKLLKELELFRLQQNALRAKKAKDAEEKKEEKGEQKALEEFKKLIKKLNEELEGFKGKKHPTQKRKKLIDEFFNKDENRKLFAALHLDFAGTKVEIYKKYNIQA